MARIEVPTVPDPIRPNEEDSLVGEVDSRAIMMAKVGESDGGDNLDYEIVGDEAQDTFTPKVPTRPYTPTKAEVEAHEITHLPYRIWCAYASQAREYPLRMCTVMRPVELASRSASITVSWAMRQRKAHLLV